MSRKIVGILAILVIALAASAVTPSYAQYYAVDTYKSVWMQLVDPTGAPFANERVIAVVWNESGNCAMAYFDGYTNDTGYIWLTIIQEGAEIPIPNVLPSGEYNVTIAIQKYGRWLLLNWSLDIDPDGITFKELDDGYLNETITAGHWWILNFSAWTDLDGDGDFEIPLYFADPEDASKEDLALFKVYWNDTRELIAEISADSGTNVAEELFNISDTEITYSVAGLEGCFLITDVENVTLFKETFWQLWKNPGETLDVKVGEDLLEFNYTLYEPDQTKLNETDLVTGIETPMLIGTDADHVLDITDHAHTFVAGVNILDPCEKPIYTGSLAVWKVFWQATLDGKNVILRSGKPNFTGYAPDHGYTFDDYATFWLPNITALYGVNVTLNIEYYEVMVFTATVNTSDLAAVSSWTDKVDTTTFTYMTHTPDYDEVAVLHKFYAKVSVVPTAIIIKDSEPTAQPLEGAIIKLYHVWGDPIETISWMEGYVHLPPFHVMIPGTGPGGPVVTYQSLYGITPPTSNLTRIDEWDFGPGFGLRPAGYLPVPFSYIKRPDLLYNYTLQIFWALPGSDKWLDVTIADNSTIFLNVTDAYVFREGCEAYVFKVFTAVYEAKFQLVDLCDRPITAADFPGATAILWIKVGEEWITATGIPAGIGGDGTLSLGQVPASSYRIRLWYKGVEMRANMTESPDEEPIVDVTNNVWQAITLRYPIGDLNVTVTMWDVNAPLESLDVMVEYLKDGNVVWTQGNYTTGCDGRVTLEKVPLAPVEDSPYTYEVVIKVFTREDTPYTRTPEDGNLLVGEKKLTLTELELVCEQEIIIPTWIYSFKLFAVDHAGTVLSELTTDVGTYPVVVVLNDSTYDVWPEYCPHVPPCPCYYNITTDFRIVNMTGPTDAAWGFTRNGLTTAEFVFTSVQFYESDEFTPKKYPHLFVAGAKYHFMVFHGGVLVYNYTITLPRPYENLVTFFNETDFTTTTAKDWTELNYTWTNGNVAHPILRFTGAPSWLEGGERYDTKLELVTWTQTLDIYTLSNAADYIIPYLNVTLARVDVLNWTIVEGLPTFADLYANLTGDQWGIWTNYFWNAVDDDGDGKITITVPAWLPNRKGAAWLTGTTWTFTVDLEGKRESWKSNSIKFGTYIPWVFILAGSEWGSIDVPDTPSSGTWYITNATGVRINRTIYGYVVNWNYTEPWVYVGTFEEKFYPIWWKAAEDGTMLKFKGNDTSFYGDNWNMTYWSGAAKTPWVTAMDGFCITVSAPDLRDNKVPLANQPVKVTAEGYEEGEVQLNDIVYTDENGEADFEPTTKGTTTLPSGETKPIAGDPIAYKFDVPGFNTSLFPYLEYLVETWLNFEDVVEPYGLKTEDVLDLDVLQTTVVFSEDHNNAEECVPIEWDALKFNIEDWSGKPLRNMMVAAILRTPRAKAIPSTFAFTYENGSVILYVPPGEQTYEIKVFWRDSYLLYSAGKIPKSIDIYDSVADEATPRLYAPGTGATIQAYVYVGLVRLFNAEGEPLSTEALEKITVTITWPDMVVTTHKPQSDGTVQIILNKDTVKSWPFAESSKYSPESPHPQSPVGDYHVVVEWAGVGKLAEKTFRIHKARTETPEIVFDINLNVVDMTVSFKTPFDTPLAGASVTLTKLDGTTIKTTVGTDGTVFVSEVPRGTLKVRVDEWNGMTVAAEGEVSAANPTFVASNIGKLVVRVVGSRGQGLEGASVVVQGTPISGKTDAGGAFSVELPAGSYTVAANKGGKTGTASVTVTGGEVAEAEIRVDVFMTIAGWEISTGEFAGLLLLIALMVIVLFIIAHEYAAWRRRRIARAVVPAKPAETE